MAAYVAVVARERSKTMQGIMMAWQFMNLILLLALAGGFVLIVVALWRMSQALQSIAVALRLLVADRVRMTNDQ
jgi:hypothetical protein